MLRSRLLFAEEALFCLLILPAQETRTNLRHVHTYASHYFMDITQVLANTHTLKKKYSPWFLFPSQTTSDG